jgi:hypothetical protein
MLEIRFPSALAMDQLALVADGLQPALGVPVNKKVVIDLTDLQRVSAFGIAALGARLIWLIRTRRMPSGSTIRRPESNRVGNDLLRMGLYQLIQEGSDKVYRGNNPLSRPQELWLVDRQEDLAEAIRRLIALLRLVLPASEENFGKVAMMMQALGDNVFMHSAGSSAMLCAQAFPKSGIVEFAVADTGCGLKSSLKPAPKDDAQALQQALSGSAAGSEKVSSLAALAATAKLNKGEMAVISGTATWAYRAGATQSGSCKSFPGTVVGLRLPLFYDPEAEPAEPEAKGANKGAKK